MIIFLLRALILDLVYISILYTLLLTLYQSFHFLSRYNQQTARSSWLKYVIFILFYSLTRPLLYEHMDPCPNTNICDSWNWLFLYNT